MISYHKQFLLRRKSERTMLPLVIPHTLLPALSPTPLHPKFRIRHRIPHSTHLRLLLRSPPNIAPPEHLHRCLHTARRALTVKLYTCLEYNCRRFASRTRVFVSCCLKICCCLAERWLRLFCGPWSQLVMAVVLFPHAGFGFASWTRGLGGTWLRCLWRKMRVWFGD